MPEEQGVDGVSLERIAEKLIAFAGIIAVTERDCAYICRGVSTTKRRYDKRSRAERFIGYIYPSKNALDGIEPSFL